MFHRYRPFSCPDRSAGGGSGFGPSRGTIHRVAASASVPPMGISAKAIQYQLAVVPVINERVVKMSDESIPPNMNVAVLLITNSLSSE